MEQKIEQLLSLIREYNDMKKLYLSCYERLSIIRDELRAGKYGLKDMVNFIYVMREISKLADDLRKESDGVGHMLENVACALWVSQNETKPIRASLATGTPDCKLAVKVPSRKTEPERFQQLMDFFGVPESAVEARVIKPYWPGLCEHVSLLSEEGKPLPPGINPEDTYPTYKVRVKMITNLDELVRALQEAKEENLKEAEKEELKLTKELKKDVRKTYTEAGRKEVEAFNELLTTRK